MWILPDRDPDVGAGVDEAPAQVEPARAVVVLGRRYAIDDPDRRGHARALESAGLEQRADQGPGLGLGDKARLVLGAVPAVVYEPSQVLAPLRLGSGLELRPVGHHLSPRFTQRIRRFET